MRSVPAGSFERLSRFEALWAAWRDFSRGKRRQPAIAAFDLDADRHLLRLHRDLRAGTYRPAPCRLEVVHDPKTRLVAAPAIRDRVLHAALLADIGPAYERGFSPRSFACCQGRGPHRAALAFLAAMRRYRHRVSLDVRRYFPSVSQAILGQLYHRRLRDPATRALVTRLIASGGEVYRSPLAVRVLGLAGDPLPPGSGLPLGGYFSHWSGALYLDGLDHFVQRTLKVRGYLRYMDDLALFGDSVAELEEAREAVREWLARERRLELKRRRDGRPADLPAGDVSRLPDQPRRLGAGSQGQAAPAPQARGGRACPGQGADPVFAVLPWPFPDILTRFVRHWR